MNNRLTIRELAAELAKSTGKEYDSIERFLSELVSVISEKVFTDRLVQVKGIGTFKVIQVEERASVDVNTKERIVIPAHYKISFAPEKELRDTVNKPFSFFESIEINDDSDFSSFEAELEKEKTEDRDEDGDIDDLLEEEEEKEQGEQREEKEQGEQGEEKEQREEEVRNLESGILKSEISEPGILESEISESEIEEEEVIEPVVAESPRVQPLLDDLIEKIEDIVKPEPAKAAPVVHIIEPAPEPAIYAVKRTPEAAQPAEEPQKITFTVEEEVNKKEVNNEKETNQKNEKNMNEFDEDNRRRDTYRREREYVKETNNNSSNNTLVILLLVLVVILAVALGSVLFMNKDVLFQGGSDNVAAKTEKTEKEENVNQFTLPGDEDESGTLEDKWGIEDENTPADPAGTGTTPEATSPNGKTDGSNIIATVKTKRGDRLNLIALEHYGNKLFWVYIYEQNKSKIDNPNSIPVGLSLDIPAKSVYGIDANSAESIRKASVLQTQILSKYPSANSYNPYNQYQYDSYPPTYY